MVCGILCFLRVYENLFDDLCDVKTVSCALALLYKKNLQREFLNQTGIQEIVVATDYTHDIHIQSG